MRFVDKATQVEIGFDSDGLPMPRAFTWQGRRLEISDWGRRWEEKGDQSARHFLIMVSSGNRFELVQHVASGQWRVVRVWEPSAVV